MELKQPVKIFEKLRFSEDENTMILVWNQTVLPFVNGIIRIIRSEVPNVAFENVTIIENTTLFQNEFIQQRVQLIPLILSKSPNEILKSKSECDCLEGTCSKCSLIFTCELNNQSKMVTMLCSDQLICDQKDVPAKVFPGIEIIDLNPGQKVKFTAKARKDIPRTQIRYASACKSTFIHLDKKSTTVQERNDPHRKFQAELCIESIGHQKPQQILLSAFQIFHFKLKRLSNFLKSPS